MEIKDLGKKEFKVNYGALRKAVLKCELDKKSMECKKAMEELNIKVYDDGD